MQLLDAGRNKTALEKHIKTLQTISALISSEPSVNTSRVAAIIAATPSPVDASVDGAGDTSV
jgi:hypothetical protein